MTRDICSQCGETGEYRTMKQWSDFETDLLCDNCFNNKIKLESFNDLLHIIRILKEGLEEIASDDSSLRKICSCNN